MKTKLTAEALKVVLVVDFLSRSSQGISKVSFDYRRDYNLAISYDEMEKLKSIRFINRVCYLTF